MSVFDRLLARRGIASAGLLVFTGILGIFAARVKPDYSVEQFFPTFHQSRIDYERFKKDFPFEDARAIVVMDAPDLFTPEGLRREAALEEDLAKIPGVVDTQGLTTTKDVVGTDDGIRMEKIFPRTDLSPDELAHARKTATGDPLFTWNLAPPDGHATIISVTLSKEHASKEATRTQFLKNAREVLKRHEASGQKLILNGLPVIRSEFTELINDDLGRLFPIALVVILLLLYVTFRSFSDIAASVITILFSVGWTYGAMGIAHVPIQILTNITPTIVMIVSISDTVHIVQHYKEALGRGESKRHAIVDAMKDSAIPCLLTEITIAGGFISLIANDVVMVQQFGIVTAAGMLLTWFANVTVLPLALSFFRGKGVVPDKIESGASRTFRRCVQWIERTLLHKPRAIVVVTVVIVSLAAIVASRVGREYYAYDDLRPDGQLAKNLRYVEKTHGGVVPMAIYIEPPTRAPDAMLEPKALALIDRIGTRLEQEFPQQVKNASSLAKVMRKAHRLLAGEELLRESPLPKSRALASQELLAVDDPRTMRDVLSFDRGTAAVFCMMPDEGSSKATKIIAQLHDEFARESAATGYKITLTGIYGIADGIYRSSVGGLAASFGIALLISFGIFAIVLRSVRLAAIGLVPNVLPIILTFGFMSLLRIDIKPSTVLIFSITLVIADDDTIQYLSRFRSAFLAHVRAGHPDPHTVASLETLRETGLPMFVTACAVSAGFLTLLFSRFIGLANLGLLIGISLLSAVFADLFLSPLLLMRLRPRLAKSAPPQRDAVAKDAS